MEAIFAKFDFYRTTLIANQKNHHKVKTYREEIEELIKEYDVAEYDQKYFWS